MKILIVQNTDWVKRNPAHQHHLAEILSLRGHEFRVIDYEINWRSEPKRKLLAKKLIFNDVSKIYAGAMIKVIRPAIIHLPLLDYVSLQFTQRHEIQNQMKEFKPDVVVAMGLSGFWALTAAQKEGIPFINYWIDVSHRLIPLKVLQPIGKLMEKRSARQAYKSLAINEKLIDYVVKLGARPERTAIVKGGINTRCFNPDLKSSKRKELGISEQDKVLLFVGWLYKFSGLKEVAAQMAKNTDSGLKLLIVGEGDAYNELLRLRETLNLKDRLILTGQKPFKEVPAYIAAADICLLPSYPWEPIMQDIVPIKLYDYMAMGKPVICTKLQGVMKEFGTESGMIFVEKPEDVVDKAVELMESHKMDDLGARTRRFVEQNSWDKIADRLEEILNDAVKNNKGFAKVGLNRL